MGVSPLGGGQQELRLGLAARNSPMKQPPRLPTAPNARAALSRVQLCLDRIASAPAALAFEPVRFVQRLALHSTTTPGPPTASYRIVEPKILSGHDWICNIDSKLRSRTSKGRWDRANPS